MRFFLGTHRPNWLGMTDVDLFVSNRTLQGRRTYPRALGQWALDSGGFSELSMFGHWETSAERYIANVRLYRDEVGGLQWAAPQDWMCEPQIVAKTGLTVKQHQERTVANLLLLRALGPELAFIPVLQGWERDDYLWHWEMYEAAGIQLDAEPLVGVGSVCRRHAVGQIDLIMESLQPLRLHGFGVKSAGLRVYSDFLSSSDSMAWSFTARHEAPLAGCHHKACSNCLRYALRWRTNVMRTLDATQLRLVEIDHSVTERSFSHYNEVKA